MSKLIYIPTMHDPWCEAGRSYALLGKKLEGTALKSRLDGAFDEYWSAVRAYLSEEKITKVYLEGLTQNKWSFRRKKVDSFASAGSRTANTALDLSRRGGVLMKTESAFLFDLQNCFRVGHPLPIWLRDRYISSKICNTLLPNDCGVLLLGEGHIVDKMLGSSEIDLDVFDREHLQDIKKEWAKFEDLRKYSC